MDNDLLYLLALQKTKGIGPVRARQLLSHFPSAEAIFKAKERDLVQVDGIGAVHAKSLGKFTNYHSLEKEINFIEKNQIQVLSIKSDNYPSKLKRCYDAPMLLFYKGTEAILNKRVVAVIGTRANSDYGKSVCEKIISELSESQPLIVSGLAYGIDVIAHKAALRNGLETVGVLAHGLDKLYPAVHKKVADEMLERGGLLTEFLSGTNPDRENFPARNRIVAGLSDAVLVIETDTKGGSMITAEIGYSYDREILCVPGKLGDKRSAGCNYLIKSLKGQLIETGEDIIQALNWDDQLKRKPMQGSLFLELSPIERQIYDFLTDRPAVHIEQIIEQTELSSSQIASTLLTLEMQGLLRSLPGKSYELT